MMVETEDREIDLKDLLFKILYSWRQILIAGLIVALALGIFKYVKPDEIEEKAEVLQELEKEKQIKEILKKDYSTVEEMKEEKYQTNLGKNAASEDMRKADEEILLKKLSVQQNLLDNSILLNIDPYNKPLALLRYKVTVSDAESLYRDPADEIVDDMITGLAESESIQNIAAELGTDVAYVKELFSVSGDYTGNYVVIQSTGIDKDMVLNIVGALETELLNKAKKDTRFRMGAKLVKYQEYYTEGFDDDLLTKQTGIKNTINDINKSLFDNKSLALQNEYDRNQLTEKKETYDAAYAIVEEEVLKEEGKDSEEVNRVKNAIRFAIIGFIAGMFIYAVCVAIGYILKPLLRNQEEMQEYYGYMVLGAFDKHVKKNLIDKLLQKWEGNLTGISDEQVIDRVLVSIGNQIKEGEKILILGTIRTEKMKNVAEKIKSAFPQNVFDVSGDIKGSAEDLKRFIDSDKVLLIEETDVSKMKDVDYQANQIIAYEKQVIGCILL